MTSNAQRLFFAFGIALAFLPDAARPQGLVEPTSVLDLNARIDCQRSIEAVSWEHRDWPALNRGPKPPLEEVLPAADLRQKVLRELRFSVAMETFYGNPLTAKDLRSELERMSNSTRDPERLVELFGALDDDPILIAECLVRPRLAERRLRERYASDRRLHAAPRSRAERAVGRLAQGFPLAEVGALYGESRWRPVASLTERSRVLAHSNDQENPLMPVAIDEWESLRGLVGGWMGVDGTALRAGMTSPLVEDEAAFFVAEVLESNDEYLGLGIAEWPKEQFESWWKGIAPDLTTEVTSIDSGFRADLVVRGGGGLNSPGTWSATSLTGAPSPRYHHTAVWTGSEVVVWAGALAGGVTQTGNRYDPATNTWSSMSTTSAPAARREHTAIWTGSEVIVWGGWNGAAVFYSSGGRYNPALNAWSATTTTGAPAGRIGHSATWNGSEMIVWGGELFGFYFSDGKRYATNSNSWGTVLASGAPSARAYHSAAFSATLNHDRFFVWGGQDADGVLGDGAYLREGIGVDGWNAISSFNAPLARSGHSTFVAKGTSLLDTARRMIVWGGFDGASEVADGALLSLFFPFEWTPIPTFLAPSARQGHTAAGNTRQMVVWGGHQGASLRNSAAVLNITNNIWRVQSSSGAPAARKFHTATWRDTGLRQGEMVVFGGWTGAATATGGQLTPLSDFAVQCDPLVNAVPGALLFESEICRVESLSSFQSAVALSCSGPFVGCTFNEPSITPPLNGSDTTPVTLTISDSAPVGTLNYSVVGNSTSPFLLRLWNVTLEIQDFDIGCSPQVISVAPGGLGSSTCSVTSVNDFDDPVNLTCQNLGFATCVMAPNPVSPPQNGTVAATLEIAVDGSAVPGTYDVEVSATYSGALRTFGATLQVINPDPIVFVDGFENTP